MFYWEDPLHILKVSHQRCLAWTDHAFLRSKLMMLLFSMIYSVLKRRLFAMMYPRVTESMTLPCQCSAFNVRYFLAPSWIFMPGYRRVRCRNVIYPVSDRRRVALLPDLMDHVVLVLDWRLCPCRTCGQRILHQHVLYLVSRALMDLLRLYICREHTCIARLCIQIKDRDDTCATDGSWRLACYRMFG